METFELPTITSGESLATEICESLQQEFNIDIKGLLTTPGLSDKERIKLAASHLVENIFLKAHAEQREDYDLLSSNNLSDIVAQAIETEPNISYSQKDALALTRLQGDELKNYVYNLAKRFEMMSKSKSPGQLVAELAGSALMSVGVAMGKEVIKNLIAKQALKTAMLNGIKSIGMGTIMVTVALVLVGLLYYLLVDNPKKILGLVVNNTDENFVVHNYTRSDGDLCMVHGQMVNFMEDLSDGIEGPKVQLKERLNFGEGDEENMVFAGIYFADRNVGFRGSEGLALFSSKSNDNFKFAHMFAVPYTNDNRTNMRLLNARPGNLETLFRELYNPNKQRVDFVENGYRLVSTVNHARGGVVACIAFIGKV
ncbi:hypothetical protein HNP38_001556 [Chryseobacterium defluvii]|uniref:Uncharacterized protein n=1 Tax=Chryseobacterium defluvii TaxID=160396 RepID=A0A840KEY4_9FLAO|nr:hypothetical protein [Chryseobacterium defluvii]MBB4806284.1 hypothetical protein [Chryseobacterium defluvii]